MGLSSATKTMTINGQIIWQSVVVTAGLEQVLLATVLYLILGLQLIIS
jgi:hypothetical protein